VQRLAVANPQRIPAARYYDPEFFELECERLWPHGWQMACRLEEIPDVGDFVEYRILDQSIIVVRVDRDTIKAYFNACRHTHGLIDGYLARVPFDRLATAAEHVWTGIDEPIHDLGL
jgi:Rieske [2Fe-2S] domain